MIKVVDEDQILTPNEKHELKIFIINNCLCTYIEGDWLRRVILKNDGPESYLGYYTMQFYEEAELDYRLFEASIILNTFWLRTLERMKRTLAHEYGHHWTLGHMVRNSFKIDPYQERAELAYYKMRGLLPIDSFAPDDSMDWHHCDKEILAEDYKFLFTPYQHHAMENFIGMPSHEVRCYIWDMGFARIKSWEDFLKIRHSPR